MKITVNHFADFLLAKRLGGLSPRTITTYQHRIGHFVNWIIYADEPLTRSVIRTYISHISETRTLPGVAAYIRDLSAFCGWLVNEGYLSQNPASKMRPRLPKRKTPSYSVEQLRALLTDASLRDRALICTLLDTGLRVGEIVQMKRTSVDPETGHFTIIGKGNKERSVWMNEFAMEQIDAYLQSRTDDSPYLWVGRFGSLTPSGLHRIIHRRAMEVGIRDDVSRLVHSFRATFARFYIKRGGDIETLRELLGHESIEMSARYAQLVQDELAIKKRQIDPLSEVLTE